MRVNRVLAIVEKDSDSREPKICEDCKGKGWRWSELGFGDLMSDRSKLPCKLCNSSGRVVTLTVSCEVTAPFDFTIQNP